MRFFHARTAGLLASIFVLSSAAPALAQQPPPPPPAPPPVVVVAPLPAPEQGYVAPLQQLVQPSYVPQSVAMSGPPVMDWSEGRLVPPGYHPDTRVRKGPIIGGSILLGTMYTFSLLAAAIGQDSAGPAGHNGEAALYAPVVGPFIAMGSSSTATGTLFLAMDGLGQVAGAALLAYGIVSPKPVVVRNDLGSLQIAPTPMILGRDGNGFGVVGKF